MNKLHFILTALLLLFIGTISAQENGDSEKRALEREIKTSGLYLYGEAVGSDKAQATRLAKSVLISEINKEIMNHSEWQFAKTIKADDIEYVADMMDLARGNKIRAIAYLKKENIQAVFADNAPKVKLADKKEEKEEKKEEKKTEPEKTTDIEPKTAEKGKNESTNVKNSSSEQSELLTSIINATSVTEINKILRLNKTKGKVAYGGINTLIDSSKAYILIYTANDNIIAILDKGEGLERKDLISGENKNTEDLYKEKGNMRIWFQLF